MLSQRRLASSLRPCFRSLHRPVATSSRGVPARGIISSAVRQSSLSPDPPPPQADEDFEDLESLDELTGNPREGEANDTPTSYREFMEKFGHQYRFAKPMHYLAPGLPFPMNTSFKPPPPISDRQRNLIYKLYMEDPRRNGVRRLAKRFNISLKRMDAILRLKGLEADWIRGKQLQNGFQVGMDRLLGAQTHNTVSKLEKVMAKAQEQLDMAFERSGPSMNIPRELADPNFKPPDIEAERSDVHQADMLEEAEQRDAARYRYERLYWESVPEDGREPRLPTILQHVKQLAELKKMEAEVKNKKRFMTPVPETAFVKRPKLDVVIRRRQWKPSTRFIDVGAQFMDFEERMKRVAMAERRAKVRHQKSIEKIQAV